MSKAEKGGVIAGEYNVNDTNNASDTTAIKIVTRTSTSTEKHPDEESMSPKTALEQSLLAIIKPKATKGSTKEKRTKVTRKFAESLTEKEVHERLKKQFKEKNNTISKGSKTSKSKKRRKIVVLQRIT